MADYNDIDSLRSKIINMQAEISEYDENTFTELLNNEFENHADDPNNCLLDFCNYGLNQFEAYQPVEIPPIYNLYIKGNSTQKTKRIKLVIFKLIATATAIILASISAGLVSLALGFDLFGYIFGWDDGEVATISKIQPITPQFDIAIFPKEPAFYDKINEVPESLSILIPEIILKNYDFIDLNYIPFEEKHFRISYYFENSDNTLMIEISNPDSFFVEYENDYVERIIDGQVYYVFKNIDRHQISWERGGIMFIVNSSATFEELTPIISELSNVV